MKLIKIVFSVLTFLMMTALPATTVLAQTSAKVIAIVNRADWCGTCKAHGPRVMALIPSYAGKGIVFALNDLSNAATVAASNERLTKLGVANIQGPMIYTGVILLVDASTHQVLKTVSMAAPTLQIEADIAAALARK